MNNNPIGIFDSGIGGITVLDECRKLLKNESFVYVSDSSGAPYGNKTEAQINVRIEACVSELDKYNCKAIVAACNTATNVGIASMRDNHPQPFIGLEPALKPASEMCGKGQVLVLTTVATSRQPKFKQLKEKYCGKNFKILPQKELAMLIENNSENLEILAEVLDEIFEPYPNACGVVLGCTHYVFLKDLIKKHYGDGIKVFDGNEGAARRLYSQLNEKDLMCGSDKTGGIKFVSI